jgi:hypothetical protein
VRQIDNPVTAPATVNELVDHESHCVTAWEGDQQGASGVTHESGDRPVDWLIV